MKIFLKTFIIVILSLLAINSGAKYLGKSNDHFHIDKIKSTISYDPQWEIPCLDDGEIKQALAQPYKYLAKGGQSFAFESQDGKYVLKFIRFSYLRPKLKYRLLQFFPYFKEIYRKDLALRKQAIHDLYQGYKWGIELTKESSGLLLLHFNSTHDQFETIALTDKKGHEYRLDLDQTVFILQRKGRSLDLVLRELLEAGDVAAAQGKIEKILEMYRENYRKGLSDLDYGVTHNTGFIGDTPFHFDLGKLTYNEKMTLQENQKADLLKVTSRLKSWLKAHHPEYESAIIAHNK